MLPIVAVSAAAALGWRSVWLGAASVLIIACTLLFRLPGAAGGSRPIASGATAGEAKARSYTRAEMLHDLRFYLIMPALVGPSFVVTGLFFHQVHLTEVKGWELSWFAACFAAYAGASTVAVMLSGPLIDRLGAVRLMPIYLLPLGLGCATLALGRHDLVALAFMSLAGLTSGSAVTVVTSMWAEIYGVGHLGAIRALAASVAVVASALAPASRPAGFCSRRRRSRRSASSSGRTIRPSRRAIWPGTTSRTCSSTGSPSGSDPGSGGSPSWPPGASLSTAARCCCI